MTTTQNLPDPARPGVTHTKAARDADELEHLVNLILGEYPDDVEAQAQAILDAGYVRPPM